MFVDQARITIKAGEAATVRFHFTGKNMLLPEDRTAETAAEAEISFFKWTTIFPH